MGRGKKLLLRMALEPWQQSHTGRHPELLLRGLLHSDGCRFENTGRDWRNTRYKFDNPSLDVRRRRHLHASRSSLDRRRVERSTSLGKEDVRKLDRLVGPNS